MTANPALRRYRVGEMRPSQILYTGGVGAIIDLPRLSGLIMGLDDWDMGYAREIGEDRLLATVRAQEGLENVAHLMSPPVPQDGEAGAPNPFDSTATVGIPVTPFPRWLLCPWCRLLAPIERGNFKLKVDRYRPERTSYAHDNCPNAKKPVVLASRFMVACRAGHLDDFPWRLFVHKGPSDCNGDLRLRDSGITGEVTDVYVICDGCGVLRQMTAAFGREGLAALPLCRGRRPHLRDYDEGSCEEQLRTILLGASNSWFPLSLSALAIPTESGKLAQLVEEAWPKLQAATSMDILRAFRSINMIPALATYSDEEVWSTIEARRGAPRQQPVQAGSLRTPEWEVFVAADPRRNAADFRLKPVAPPQQVRALISQVVLVERLRQVQALIGFTRIESPGDLADVDDFPPERRAPLARKNPTWVPATEVRGEGIFLRFDEDAVRDWELSAVAEARARDFIEANRQWRAMRGLPAGGFPGIRYVLLHSFAHALMRQMVLECGYNAASVRERIYALPPESDDGPMAGILIYTAAPDSEGTLGGLVSLGYPGTLGRHIEAALERVDICASDPYCSEHNPHGETVTLHGAACHACLFVPETSCERGNRFLDRSALVETIIPQGRAFFAPQR